MALFTLMQKLDSGRDDQYVKSAIVALDIVKNFTSSNDSNMNLLNTNLETALFFENGLKSSRLPFHCLMEDPWTVLVPELNENTINRLIPLCHPLNLSKDKFYATVLQNLVDKLV